MTQENTQTETQDQPSVGHTLKSHREQANVSLESLTNPLKLSVVQLQHLENDEFQLLGPATFVKGYIKNYCRELNIDCEPILALLPEAPVPQKPAKMQSFSRRTEKEANDNRLMLVSYLILAIVIGSSAVWWWQNATPIEEQVQLRSNSNTGVGTQQSQLTASHVVQNDRSQTTQSTLLDDAPTSVQTVSTITASPQAQPQQENTINNTLGQSDTTDIARPVIAPAEIKTAEQNASKNSTIVMNFSDDSWVEIHDAQGDKIAFGVKKAGYTMTVSGIAPFSVVLGKHTVVSITLNGENVDISAFAPNRLAKFKLPLAE
ncbi:DUF4115 domain-containing protein [Pseudoalteromonas sp. MMG010]|uniref:RodZ domain-containing protein n=1 Tax=Pseudoalteromonas sp. MMG010 TaxID=2822685 RepID=UPI001B3A324C|nr:RodZ domain-containing protein [Pseudoalteromonas sp. MMG010]MBQ4833532.1 DUF4115 domain-containing protein [Pseudoalteromonas sp. MMG010]